MVNQMTANSKREDEEKRLEAEEGLAKIELEVIVSWAPKGSGSCLRNINKTQCSHTWEKLNAIIRTYVSFPSSSIASGPGGADEIRGSTRQIGGG